jgi:hypothetical protein
VGQLISVPPELGSHVMEKTEYKLQGYRIGSRQYLSTHCFRADKLSGGYNSFAAVSNFFCNMRAGSIYKRGVFMMSTHSLAFHDA